MPALPSWREWGYFLVLAEALLFSLVLVTSVPQDQERSVCNLFLEEDFLCLFVCFLSFTEGHVWGQNSNTMNNQQTAMQCAGFHFPFARDK